MPMKREIVLNAANGVNLNTVKEEMLEASGEVPVWIL